MLKRKTAVEMYLSTVFDTAQAAAIIASLLLCACGASPVPVESSTGTPSFAAQQITSPAPVESSDSTDAAIDSSRSIIAQLEIIASESALWTEDIDYAIPFNQYAVADLDANGRLEIITSYMGGSGVYTYSRFFEISEDYSNLTECSTDFIHGDSQPDIMYDTEPIQVYFDAQGVIHYIFNDYVSMPAGKYYNAFIELSLQNGSVTNRILAYSYELYDPSSNGSVTYYNADGQPITEEEYLSAAENAFADAVKRAQVTFGWQDKAELKGLSDAELLQKLESSYNNLKWTEH